MAAQPVPQGAHRLMPVYGWSPDMNCLQYFAPISPNVGYDLKPGQVCHLNPTNNSLEPGAVAWEMPLFIFQGAADLDVNDTPGQYWWPIVPGGNVMCFPGIAAMEVWTTEFDTTQTYLINQPLRAPTGNSSGSAGVSGTLTNQGILTWADYVGNTADLPTAVVGICSGGTASAPTSAGAVSGPTYVNCEGYPVLQFWLFWQPGHPSQTV